MTEWLLLTASLPTSPSGLRVRIWRSLKATGCATLRDGVYILPAAAPTAAELWASEKAILAGGAEAHMLSLRARDAAQEARFTALFDRSEAWADFSQSLKAARDALKTASEADARKSLRTLAQQVQALRQLDFFPGAAREQAIAGLEKLRQEVERKFSPGEPVGAVGDIARLDTASYQGRTWATRQRPWVDRLATAWLIQRFVDPAARFLWLVHPRDCPETALGFDFDGARFTHVGDRVSFEVVAHSFGLQHEPGLQRLAELVHFIDIGGIPVDEAAGIETLVRGLQAQHTDDDALLAASFTLFDTLHAALRTAP